MGLGHVVVRAGSELRVELRLATGALAPKPVQVTPVPHATVGREVIGVARVVLGVAGIPYGENGAVERVAGLLDTAVAVLEAV